MCESGTATTREFTVFLCGNCGSENIAESNENDSLCGDCGEWMNCEAVKVVDRTALLDEVIEALRQWAKSRPHPIAELAVENAADHIEEGFLRG